jgi:transcriptional regulator with XRE-family HTH domain
MSLQDAPNVPSDLGRRVAARRRELGLTLEQTAERAGMAPDYLYRVECNSGVVLRTQALGKLARALQTTGAALLGNAAAPPHGLNHTNLYAQLLPMEEEECWRYLGLAVVGRVIFDSERGPTALPVNYRMMGRAIVVRTDTSSHLGRLAADTGAIGFEVDHIDDAFQEGWSVLASGTVRHLEDDQELTAVRGLDVVPWAGGNRNTYLIIDVSLLTGRRIESGQH